MRRVSEIDGLRGASQVCVAGESWVYFRWSPSLSGMALFGRPTRDHAEAFARALTMEFAADATPHAFYVDARLLSGVDPDAFAAMVAVYDRHFERAASLYTALALVVPPGVEGAVVAGFHGGKIPPFPFRATPDDQAAREWVSMPDVAREALTAQIAECRSTASLVLSLRALMVERPDAADADQLARALGLSARTLQRRLQEAGTTLQRELMRQRMESAQRRLLETDTPITVIALDLGFATSQHFSRTFRDATGMTPTVWRNRKR